MRRRIGRKTGSLILAAALIAASAQPVMAEQGENEAQGQKKQENYNTGQKESRALRRGFPTYLV